MKTLAISLGVAVVCIGGWLTMRAISRESGRQHGEAAAEAFMQRMAGTPEEQEEFRRGLEERAREADKKANEMRDEMEALMRRNGAEDGVKLLPPRISISESTDER